MNAISRCKILTPNHGRREPLRVTSRGRGIDKIEWSIQLWNREGESEGDRAATKRPRKGERGRARDDGCGVGGAAWRRWQAAVSIKRIG